MRFHIMLAVLLLAPGAPAAAQARALVHAAERAVSDDSADVPRARWSAALARDTSDRAALLGLGTLHRLTYDFAAAERHFGRLLAGARETDEWTVQARLGLYRVALAGGDYRRGDSLLVRAIADARRLGDRGSEMDALIGFANTRGAGAGLDASFAVLDSLRAILPPGDGWERVQYLCRLGILRGIQSDSTATGLTARGIAMAQRLGERRLTGHCFEAHALAHSLLGHSDSALANMDRSEALLTATHDHASLARLASRRSDELQSRGRLGESRVELRKVLAHAEISRNRERYAFAYGGLGSLALRLNDLATAEEHFERAAALYDSLGQGVGSMIARQNRVWVLSLGDDLAEARAAGEAVLAEVAGTGDLEDEVYVRQLLARIAIRQEDWATAGRQLAAAEAEAAARGRGEEARRDFAFERGRIALGQGDLAAAERLFRFFLDGVEPDNHLHRHLARNRLAQVYAARGDVERAERELAGSGEELETWRASLGDDELRRFAFSARALGEHDPQAPVAAVLAALVRAGRVEPAFALAEQRRARALTDRLNQADALREAGDAAEAHRVRPVSAAELAAALPDDSTALLEFVAGSEGAPTTVFVATRAGLTAQLLPSVDSLAAPIRRLVAMVETGGDPAAIVEALGRTLMGPVADSLPPRVRRLVVVPDGPLHRMPFDALRLPDGRAAVERWAIGLAPSAGVAVGLWRARPARDAGPVRLLALGDPEFPGERGVATWRAFAAEGGLPRLGGSGDEAREVARYAPDPEVRLRRDASEQWFKRAALDRFQIIHLATHALVDETSLARTALALAPGEGEDGFLSPADLAALRLDADLVVLSACRTAGGVAITGEGMEGLTAPLVAAGARSVVATQWRIADRSTVRLVGDFYAAMAKGLPVADALREAKLAAIARGAPAGDWAGFTVVGDPLATVPLTAPSPSARHRNWWLATAGLALVGVLVYGVRRSGRRSERRSGEPTVDTHQR